MFVLFINKFLSLIFHLYVSVYKFKDNKILTVDRSDKFISEIIIFCLNAFYDKTILERYFKISLGIMNIINYCWWYETLNQAILQN